MITKLLKKYLSIIFILATLLGVLHHHNDLKQHNDCQICTIQTNLTNADTPSDTVYITQLDIKSESIITKLLNLHTNNKHYTFQARAPPFFS